MTDLIKRPRRWRKMAREPETVRAVAAAATPMPDVVKPLRKAAMVEQMLEAEGGITLAELCEATGWLPHTTRAFLTGLRKKGRAVERTAGEDGKSIYRITSRQAAA